MNIVHDLIEFNKRLNKILKFIKTVGVTNFKQDFSNSFILRMIL